MSTNVDKVNINVAGSTMAIQPRSKGSGPGSPRGPRAETPRCRRFRAPRPAHSSGTVASSAQRSCPQYVLVKSARAPPNRGMGKWMIGRTPLITPRRRTFGSAQAAPREAHQHHERRRPFATGDHPPTVPKRHSANATSTAHHNRRPTSLVVRHHLGRPRLSRMRRSLCLKS